MIVLLCEKLDYGAMKVPLLDLHNDIPTCYLLPRFGGQADRQVVGSSVCLMGATTHLSQDCQEINHRRPHEGSPQKMDKIYCTKPSSYACGL